MPVVAVLADGQCALPGRRLRPLLCLRAQKMEYPINRFAMEAKRQMDVPQPPPGESRFLAGDDYSIADIAVWPWYGALAKGQIYEAGEFLSVHEYTTSSAGPTRLPAPGARRGRMVNRTWGRWTQLHERHEASDFDTRTQDKLAG